MDSQEIRKRLKVLYWVLQFNKQYQTLFTVGECIVINQERGSLLHKLTYSEKEVITVPPTLESKIQNALVRMAQINWLPLNPIDLLTE